MSNERDPLERQLRAMTPTAPDLDRDATLFRMGRASVPRQRVWPWQAATALSSSLALFLALIYCHQPPPATLFVDRVVEREVRVEVPVLVPSAGDILSLWGTPAEPRELSRQRRIEDQISRHGLDGVPGGHAPGGRTPTVGELLQTLEASD
jgi:hypothetical protein